MAPSGWQNPLPPHSNREPAMTGHAGRPRCLQGSPLSAAETRTGRAQGLPLHRGGGRLVPGSGEGNIRVTAGTRRLAILICAYPGAAVAPFSEPAPQPLYSPTILALGRQCTALDLNIPPRRAAQMQIDLPVSMTRQDVRSTDHHNHETDMTKERKTWISN